MMEMRNKTKFVVETTATPEDHDSWGFEYARVSEKKARHYAKDHKKNKWVRVYEVEI